MAKNNPKKMKSGIPMEDNQKKTIMGRLQEAFKNPEIPNLYANTFIMASGTGDITLLFERNGVSVATLNVSYTVAKSLAVLLGQSISDLEKESGNTIMTTHDIEEIRKRSQTKNEV